MTPSRDEIEGAPPQISAFPVWIKAAQNQIRVFCMVYGAEYGLYMYTALRTFEQWNEQDPDQFPFLSADGGIREWWEELMHQFWYELRAGLQEIYRISKRDRLSKDEVCWRALAPRQDETAVFRIPQLWDLLHPQGWFQRQIMGRMRRRTVQALWSIAHKTPDAKPKAAPKPVPKPKADPKRNAGGDANGHGTDRGRGGQQGVPSGSPQPAPQHKWPLKGPNEKDLLTLEEHGMAVKHCPLDKAEKRRCFDDICWKGCARGAKCGFSHDNEDLKGQMVEPSTFHPTVRMKMWVNGGIRSKPELSPKEVPDMLARARASMKAEEESKRAGKESEASDRSAGAPAPKAKAKPKPKKPPRSKAQGLLEQDAAQGAEESSQGGEASDRELGLGTEESTLDYGSAPRVPVGDWAEAPPVHLRNFAVTEAEAGPGSLADATAGPDPSWLEDAHADQGNPTPAAWEALLPAEATQFRDLCSAVAAEPQCKPLWGAPAWRASASVE